MIQSLNEDINKVLNEYEQGLRDIPSVDMVVGGFPCQDYSVAKPLSKSGVLKEKGCSMVGHLQIPKNSIR